MPKPYIDYFIGIVPPEPILTDAWALKKHFRDKYNSRAALNSPPHITLHMPFRWIESKESALVHGLTQFFNGEVPFDISLNNFASFPPRVIFIAVKASPTLNDLQKRLHAFCKKELNLFNANYQDRPYHPHITLAFRDLKKQVFDEAAEEISQRAFSANFKVDRVVLFRHEVREWKIHRELRMGK